VQGAVNKTRPQSGGELFSADILRGGGSSDADARTF